MRIDKLDKVIQEKEIIYNNYKDIEKAYVGLISENMRLEKENKQLEKKLEIAVKVLEYIWNELLKINLAGLSYEDRHTIYTLMFDNGTISKALAKIKGIKVIK